jgi:hypothetical protein
MDDEIRERLDAIDRRLDELPMAIARACAEVFAAGVWRLVEQLREAAGPDGDSGPVARVLYLPERAPVLDDGSEGTRDQ